MSTSRAAHTAGEPVDWPAEDPADGPADGPVEDPADEPADPDPLDALVGEWLTVSETANTLRTSPNRVRQMVRENALAMLRLPGSREPQVPALMLQDGQVVKGLGGTLTLLGDAGYDTREALIWLFTANDAFPARPIDSLRANRVREVRRVAQALGF